MARIVRNLDNLRQTGSTARILNLLQVWEQHGDSTATGEVRSPAWAKSPLFRNPVLNRAIIIKHRLRRNEIDVFGVMPRRLATKVVVPISPGELKLGGHYFFVDQIGFESVMRESFGQALDSRDVQLLKLMDALPSLDPFLLREQLRRNGFDPAPCYLTISQSDLKRMRAFVQAEISPLVTLSLGADVVAVAENSARVLASKILSDTSGTALNALRETLRLEPHQYQEGVFCWKGFLYYKWTLEMMLSEVDRVSEAIQRVQPVGRVDDEARQYIERSRGVLYEGVYRTIDSVRRTLMIYDEAYTALKRGNPNDFRDFLLAAPRLFSRLGEELGVIQHIVTFWTFRFTDGAPRLGVEELMDILMDFETGLSLAAEDRAAA